MRALRNRINKLEKKIGETGYTSQLYVVNSEEEENEIIQLAKKDDSNKDYVIFRLYCAQRNVVDLSVE